ncbi:hypothetical protein A3F66_02455 [candidate division TM6 bacterium RIFCSPHIGHO2_12_FULL_32_22]|nr:MAG: hypothetical protein A3F66_02455 [candidate division TM6 bacterium RIFCSPHIGHO2_12_FULL_32_22]
MKKLLALILFVNFSLICNLQKFTVVGAGPAGITVVGLLLDLCIPASDITWIDRKFNVGDLSNYPTVSANTKNRLFIDFLSRCKAFKEVACSEMDKLRELELDKEYPLETIIRPLQILTKFLKGKVNSIQGDLESLFFKDDNWNLKVNGQMIVSSHVILATGSHPRKIALNNYHVKEISLIDALDKNSLQAVVSQDDTIGVVGNAHSAILILKSLSELNVKKIISFYKGSLKYTEDMGGWLLYSHSGLKGIAADWAKNVLEKNPPLNLLRIESSKESFDRYLPECTKVIQAIGFERNDIPYNDKIEYSDETGVIAPRLFGIGIAFPEKYVDPLGNVEYRVGLNSFMEYAQKMLPEWIKTKNCNRRDALKIFEELFEIELL